METIRKLEIGAGDYPKEGYEQLDSRDLPHIQYVCDARELPFNDETFNEVYSSQTLEHFGRTETWKVLKEWHRVVIKGGRVILQLPDMSGMLRDYYSGVNDWAHFIERLYGTQDYEGNTHYTMFTLDEFRYDLKDRGYKYEHVYRFAKDGGFHIEILK